MPGPYDQEHPDSQLARLDAEAGHGPSLEEGADLWFRAPSFIREQAAALRRRVDLMETDVWVDQAGRAFAGEARRTADTMDACAQAIDSAGIASKLTSVAWTRIFVREAVRKVCERYRAICDAGENTTAQYLAHCAEAGRHTSRLDRAYTAVADAMRTFHQEVPRWYGPLAAVGGAGGAGAPGAPGGPGSSAAPGTGGGSPTSAGTGDPVSAEPLSQTPADVPAQPVTAGGQPSLSDVLSAATDALGAAEGLLGGGARVPDPVSAGDLGIGDLPSVHPPGHAPGGLPALAGLDPGTSHGGGGVGSAGGIGIGGGAGPTNATGPGTGGVAGAGTAPVPGGVAATTSGRPVSAAPMMPPMHPPNTGAGTGRAAGAIKPGDSDRPVARPRPRSPSPSVTPGVALTGRAGAAAPRPAARRDWDSDNDSLQVLDENLWQVNLQEEETHGQDRRGPGRDGRDRAAAHRATDAGLVGPGRRADQPTRAR